MILLCMGPESGSARQEFFSRKLVWRAGRWSRRPARQTEDRSFFENSLSGLQTLKLSIWPIFGLEFDTSFSPTIYKN